MEKKNMEVGNSPVALGAGMDFKVVGEGWESGIRSSIS